MPSQKIKLLKKTIGAPAKRINLNNIMDKDEDDEDDEDSEEEEQKGKQENTDESS